MRWIIASILVLYYYTGIGQLPADIKFTNYTRANGLPEENINNLIQDSRGFLWLGTKEGLIRFDGLNFLTWYANPSDSAMFSNNNIVVLAEYKPGFLMFQTGNNLWQINIYNHQLSPIKQFEGKNFVAAPIQMLNGYWCIANTDSIYILNREFALVKKLSAHHLFPVNQLITFFPLQHPYTLIHTLGINRFYLLNYLSGHIKPLQINAAGLDSRSPYFTPAAFDSATHRLYLAAYFNGNFYCDINLAEDPEYKPVPIPALPDGTLRKIILLPNQRVMMGCDNGFYLTDFKETILFTTQSKTDRPIAANAVLDICKAADGTYWLATTKGLSHFSLNNIPVGYWQTHLGVNEPAFKSILKPGNGYIYLLSQEKSLIRMYEKTGSFKQIENGLNYCWSATIAGKQIIAGGGGKKLLSYNFESNQTQYPSFLEKFYTENTDLVTLVFRSKNGDMWYSCNGSGGIIRNPAGTNNYIQFSRTTSPPAFSHSYVHVAAEDSEGNIWWGSNKTQMLLKWNARAQNFSEIPVGELIEKPVIKTGINNLFVDQEDNLWIALDGSALLKYNIRTRKSNYYDINKGLPTDAVNSMCTDNRNRLWFGTRKGLCCYIPDKDKMITFTTFDGLPEDDFDAAGILYDKSENRLYAGARHSIAFFNPDSLLSKVIAGKPVVYIDEMLINGKPLYFIDEKNIILQPAENNIEFRFASPDYNRNNQLIYQYRLSGSGNEWVDLNEKRNVTFNSLPHGSYKLSVRCKYRGTEDWVETAIPFSFIIKTPWQKTWWFRLLIGFAVAVFVWALIRNYYRRKLDKQKILTEKIQAVEKERTRIATDMHDDFGASLSRIKFISEKMKLTEKENDKLKKDLSKISTYSDEMAEKMNEIVWALNQRYDSCADLVSFCRAYASEFLQDKGLKLNFSADEIPDKKVQGEVRRNTFLVMKEALHNIVKHSNAGSAQILFSFTLKTMTLQIEDNGKGFDANAIRPFANGLENMKKRMADINGNIHITSSNGTQIKLTIPI